MAVENIIELWRKFNEAENIEMKKFWYQRTFDLGYSDEAAEMYNRLVKMFPDIYSPEDENYG